MLALTRAHPLDKYLRELFRVLYSTLYAYSDFALPQVLILQQTWVSVEDLREKLRLKTEECEEKEAQLAYILGEDVDKKVKECEEKAEQLARAKRETEELKMRQERIASLQSHALRKTSEDGETSTVPEWMLVNQWTWKTTTE